MPLMEKSVLFALLFFGTIANGGLMEGKIWGVFAWGVFPLSLGVLYLVMSSETNLLPVILIGMLAIHCLYVLWTGFSYVFAKRNV